MTEEKIIEHEMAMTEGAGPRQTIEMTYAQGAAPHGDEAVGGILDGGVAGAAVGAVVGGTIGAAPRAPVITPPGLLP